MINQYSVDYNEENLLENNEFREKQGSIFKDNSQEGLVQLNKSYDGGLDYPFEDLD